MTDLTPAATTAADGLVHDLELEPERLLAFVGPTGSGKTALAMEVAERVGGEIVSVDSVQVYRFFDVGSGKPSAEELARVPHHLVSVADPLEPVDAARFVALADAAIVDVRARGRIPLLCGGTFLWMKALLSGLAEAPPASEAVRAAHRAFARTHGRPALHARLAKVDRASAARLHPNDLVRVSRALEVWELVGRRLSELHAEHGFKGERHRCKLVAIAREPKVLRARIDARVKAFLAAGWVDEVRALDARGYGEARAMGSVGYREVLAHTRGTLPEERLEDAVSRATWIFARRQKTWLGHEPVTWIENG
ncbi:MAG TPA: tRNA (adenosine(37)-N6)-dimethylallyltransferase MiaA [Polyangiaceae bacterium]